MIEVEARDLRRALNLVAPVIERRNSIPILSCARFQRDGDNLTIEATNLDTRMVARLPAKANGDGLDVTIEGAKHLSKAISAAGAGSVSLGQDADALSTRIQAGRLDVTIDGLPTDDWPIMPRPSPHHTFKATLGQDAIATLRRVNAAASTEDTRYYLNGIYLHKTGDWEWTAAATDGHRLNAMPFTMPDAAGDLGGGIIIPSGALDRLFELAADAKDAPISFTAAPKWQGNEPAPKIGMPDAPIISFATERATLHSQVIDGTFPDYVRVIPRDNQRIATFDRAEFKRAIAALLAFSKISGQRGGPAFRLDFEPDALRLHYRWADSRAGKAGWPIDYEDRGAAGISIGFNGRYLRDMIDCFPQATRIAMKLQDGGSPAVFIDPDDAGFQGVLMPMRL